MPTPSLRLPEQFAEHYEVLTDVHADLAAKSVINYAQLMATEAHRGLTYANGLDGVHYVQLALNGQDYDPTRVELRFNTAMNPFGVNTFIRELVAAKVDKALFPDDQPHQTIVIPSPNRRKPVAMPYKHVANPIPMSEKDCEIVESGNARPYVSRVLGILAGIETVNVSGYSLGASLGMAFAAYAAENGYGDIVGDSMFAEAPNLQRRTRKEIEKAYSVGSVADFLHAVDHNGIPAFTDVQEAHSVFQQIVPYIKSKVSEAMLPEQRALNKAAEGDAFKHDLISFLGFNRDAFLQVVRAEYSPITSPQGFEELRELPQAGKQLSTIVVGGYAHGLGNNLFVDGIMRAYARRGMQIPTLADGHAA